MADETKPTSIIRADHGKDNPYFMMRRSTAQDKSLSWAARGMLAYLLSQPDDWVIKTKDLEQKCKQDKVYSILEELEKARYVIREEVKDGKWANGRYRYVLYEVPCPVSPYPEKPGTDESTPYIIERIEEHKTESTESDSISQPKKPVASARPSVEGNQVPKPKTDPFYVFQTIDGKSVYTGPFKALEAAKRFASGHGTVTQRQAIPPGAATRPVPKVVQPWDVLGKAVARVFFGATDEAAVNAVYGRIAPILHGDKRSGRCIGIIEYECQRQKLARDELDYEALAAFAPVVWAYYQTKNPDKPLKDCAKILDYWQARRVLDIPNAPRAHFVEVNGPTPYNPNPNLSVLKLVRS